MLVYGEDQIEVAYTAYSKWFSVHHDRKAVQVGGIAYSGGTVRLV